MRIKKTMKQSAALFIIISAVLCSLRILFGVHVDSDERGIRYNCFGNNPGVQESLVMPGLTWRIPFLSSVLVFRITEQEFVLKDSQPVGANPHRNALVMRTPSGIQHLDVEVWYQLPASQLTRYAKTFYGISPKTVIEGMLRIQGQMRESESIADLMETVKPVLSKAGIKLMALNLINPEDT